MPQCWDVSAGDGNCFYRAFIVATLEQLCQTGCPLQCKVLHDALLQHHHAVQQWQALQQAYRLKAASGFQRLAVSCQHALLLLCTVAIFNMLTSLQVIVYLASILSWRSCLDARSHQALQHVSLLLPQDCVLLPWQLLAGC